MSNQNGAPQYGSQPGQSHGPQFAPQHQTPQVPGPYPQAPQSGAYPPVPQSNGPYAPGPVGPSGMTASEEAQHRQMLLGGIGLLIAPILLAILLSAVEAPLDPRFTGPVFSAVLIAGAALLGKTYRFKRDVRRR